MPRIVFKPSGTIVETEAGTRLIDACRRTGFAVPSPCGGKGLCGKCRVRILEGDIPADARQRGCLPPALLAEGWRAACVATVAGDLVVADPAADAGGVILTDFMAREPRGPSGVWARDAAMAAPSAEDQADDASRFLGAIALPGRVLAVPDVRVLSRLPRVLRDNAFRCRAVGLGDRLLRVGGPDENRAPLGLAVDIGTTTIAVALCDLADGTVLAVASGGNPQAIHGDDVISRIEYAGRGDAELAEMRALAVDAVRELAGEARRRAGTRDLPVLAAIAANTAMNHLLLGVSPAALAASPFIPAFRLPPPVHAADLGWADGPAPLLFTVPNIAAYVGGDITAGLLAHDIGNRDGAVLFLDVGTNGEIALAADGRILACATAAGPAFEGARIGQGMRAAPGAVSRVARAASGGVEIGTVDAVFPARGICGTGLLDAVAVFLGAGLLDESGRIPDADEIRESRPGTLPGLLSLLDESGDEPALWLERPSGRGNHGVRLTQRDIREFQLAKGAIAAGIDILLAAAGLRPEDLDLVLLAGGFGNYLDPDSARAVGLLPPAVPADRIRSVGNASLAGARLCLLSERERADADALSRRVRYIELSGHPEFQEAFATHMLFPEQYSVLKND